MRLPSRWNSRARRSTPMSARASTRSRKRWRTCRRRHKARRARRGMAKRGGQIIIKKVKKGGHGGHHGGAWKVAYADFVTAMMSFFLLLWLLNVTTDVQKRGIADYFEPTISSRSQSGAGGVLGGQTIGDPGAQSIPLSAPNLQMARMAERQPKEGEDGNQGGGATD